MDISVIIVNYRSRKYLARCISSVESFLSEVPHEIIIVNNDQENLILSNPGALVIENNSNCGFGVANNIGAAKATGQLLWFLNPDTELLSFNQTLIKKLFLNQNIGIVGTSLLTKEKKAQPWSAGIEITPWNIIRSNIGLDKSKLIWNSPTEISVDWVSGGSFLIPKMLFEEVKGFDEAFFMYYEDIDLCRRIKMLDKQILLEPSIRVLHWCGKSAKNKKLQKKQYYQSQAIYIKKHFGVLACACIGTLRLLCSWKRL